jgi:hypothetical protein
MELSLYFNYYNRVMCHLTAAHACAAQAAKESRRRVSWIFAMIVEGAASVLLALASSALLVGAKSIWEMMHVSDRGYARQAVEHLYRQLDCIGNASASSEELAETKAIAVMQNF